MQTLRLNETSHFYAVGINYKKTDAAVRGMFAINNNAYDSILQLAPSSNIDSLFILSTCNRTEIYGFATDADQLINLLCTQTKGTKEDFTRLSYTKRGIIAVEHLFNVGAGLDSQILGDYEITSQLKQAVKFSKERGFINCFLERLFNNVLQSSKTIRNETALSGGTVSVSFAAIQYIKSHVKINAATQILLIGTGKIGRNTCKNLVDYLKTKNITLINRSEDKAAELAAEFDLNCAPLTDLEKYINSSDIILVASNACEPVILASQLKSAGSKLIIDLSIPYNVEEQSGALPNIHLVNVDMLSKMNDETLRKREAETPKANEIISKQLIDFIEWYNMRRNAPALNAIKLKLNQIYQQRDTSLLSDKICPVYIDKEKIQRIVNGAASKMRLKNQHGCYYIEAINEFMAIA
ncbi:glutamyl-tRNA reductase [Mucilaginibacter sp. BJC16-A38]|uniref:glutamyl-tRNA reductase n=1 Tax=Mucilaginibacter phenanthrenivorans TaxID=1234842 RepID=UPI00215834DD|nr:glutamyl-tRNA reductase [Mucilaginibacter phenanthrenivorans]MCR8556693.1 glutamyl-tRNA reductase [Mucilaginibacter phenanthrenivorans]